MKVITSATVFQDALGTRLSATYSEVEVDTGRVISDNQRFTRVITDEAAAKAAADILAYAAESIPE